MDDSKIIEMYFARDEQAIEETKLKYGRLLISVARKILGSEDDSRQCESDTYLKTWNSIPPLRPRHFSAFLTKIARNTALTHLRDMKRHGPPELTLIAGELEEVVSDGDELVDGVALREALSDFVMGLDTTRRRAFVQRYFYMMSHREIAFDLGLTVGTVRVMLFRTREALRNYLIERGIEV